MNQRILILRLSSIGDILLTTAFIRQVRRKFPHAQIDFVIKEGFADLIRHNPHIDQVYYVQPNQGIPGLLKLRKLLAQKKYDYIFDLHHNIRTRLISPGKNRTHIQKQKWKRALLVKLGINTFETIIPVAEKYLLTAQKAEVADDQLGLELYWKNGVERKIDQVLKQHHLKEGFVGLAPGAAHFTKRWPLERFTELINLIQNKKKTQVVLFGSGAEREILEPLARMKNVHNFAGSFSLLESAALLNKAGCLVSNDSGLMHMATAVKTPLVAVFGSTVRELGFFPYRSMHKIVETTLACRPCSHIGRASCPQKHFRCMLDIPAIEVFKKMEPWL